MPLQNFYDCGMDLAQAYALLNSLKQNLPTTFEVERRWVDDFHSILDAVEKTTGADTYAFRVPPDELHPEVSGGNYLEGTTDYSGRTVIERSRFVQKVDAVLGYFQFTQSEPKKDIGFGKL